MPTMTPISGQRNIERDLADVFAIQSEIAEAIADRLQAKLSPQEKSAIKERPTSDIAAYDLYLRAKKLIYEGEVSPARQRENLFQAVQLLDQAVARDPAFVLAHCQLAGAHDLIYFFNYDHTPGRLKQAEESIANAVRLQPEAGQTHLAQAIHSYLGYLDYDRAREELTKAQQSLPNDAQVFKFLGLIDRRQGRWNEGVRNLERVVELDPRNIDGIGNLAQAYFDLRRYNEAIATFDRIAQLEPGNPTVRTFRASIELLARADVAPLRAVINTIEAEGPASAADVSTLAFELALDERDPAAAARALANIPREGYTDPNSFPFPHAWFEGLLAELRGDAPAAQSAFAVARSETEKIVREQPKNEKALSVLALIDAHLGQKDKAIQEGRAACDMLPIAKDAVDGVMLTSNLARIYAITGEKDLGLEQLEIATKLPGGPTYGELRLALEWDALRGDPRFEKIVVHSRRKIRATNSGNESEDFFSRAEATQRLQSRRRVWRRRLAFGSGCHAGFSVPGNSKLGDSARHFYRRPSVFRLHWSSHGHLSSRQRESSGPKLPMPQANVRAAVFGSPLLSSLRHSR